jgi:hypothetical protein
MNTVPTKAINVLDMHSSTIKINYVHCMMDTYNRIKVGMTSQAQLHPCFLSGHPGFNFRPGAHYLVWKFSCIIHIPQANGRIGP